MDVGIHPRGKAPVGTISSQETASTAEETPVEEAPAAAKPSFWHSKTGKNVAKAVGAVILAPISLGVGISAADSFFEPSAEEVAVTQVQAELEAEKTRQEAEAAQAASAKAAEARAAANAPTAPRCQNTGDVRPHFLQELSLGTLPADKEGTFFLKDLQVQTFEADPYLGKTTTPTNDVVVTVDWVGFAPDDNAHAYYRVETNNAGQCSWTRVDKKEQLDS